MSWILQIYTTLSRKKNKKENGVAYSTFLMAAIASAISWPQDKTLAVPQKG